MNFQESQFLDRSLVVAIFPPTTGGSFPSRFFAVRLCSSKVLNISNSLSTYINEHLEDYIYATPYALWIVMDRLKFLMAVTQSSPCLLHARILLFSFRLQQRSDRRLHPVFFHKLLHPDQALFT